MIVPLEKKHAAQVADLHISGIATGFISSLGHGFVTVLYEAIAQSPYGFGFVEENDGRVDGFVAFTSDIKGLYKTIFFRKGIRFFHLLFFKFFSIRTMKKIVENLLYPSKQELKDLPKAELLSIAVDESQRGKGIAGKLIKRGLHECRTLDLERVKVLVADFNAPANKLYLNNGFQLAGKLESHGQLSNLYVAQTGTVDQP